LNKDVVNGEPVPLGGNAENAIEEEEPQRIKDRARAVDRRDNKVNLKTWTRVVGLEQFLLLHFYS